MRIYGLTGMSGAGKSTVGERLALAGFYPIDCDKVSRRVTEKGKPALSMIERAFGKEYICADGTLNRRKLGGLVFSDGEKLKTLEKILYPYITYEIVSRINDSGEEYILLDAPTLFESGIDAVCDAVISVVCDRDISLQRIMARDGIDKKAALDRLSRQHPAEFYIKKSEYYIENNSGKERLISAADALAKRLKEV